MREDLDPEPAPLRLAADLHKDAVAAGVRWRLWIAR